MHPREKAAILKGLSAQKVALLKEQEEYRAVLKQLEKSTPPEDLSVDCDSIDWGDIEQHMKGQFWPLTSKDWSTFDGRQYFETPKQILLNQIADSDIRFHAFHFSELADETLRLKAAAHFVSYFGFVDVGIARKFSMWRQCNKLMNNAD